MDALIDGYGREVSRAFDAAKTYPRVAQMRNIEGQLMMRFDFANGALTDVSVVESSGQKVLDDAALAAARKLKLPPPGGSLARRSFYFTMPVVYRLK
ncbi:MAG TPA: TonB family protein [Methyloversatilis sp.]